jgi:hypothetical protein
MLPIVARRVTTAPSAQTCSLAPARLFTGKGNRPLLDGQDRPVCRGSPTSKISVHRVRLAALPRPTG